MKTILSICAILTLVSNLHADGPLRMKGFHHDIPFDQACKILSSFKTDRGHFIISSNNKKCGFGRNEFISSPYITRSKNSNNIETILLSPEVVNDLFDTKAIKVDNFAHMFLNRYDWIDSYRSNGVYRKESSKYRWKLMINRRKWIKITFF